MSDSLHGFATQKILRDLFPAGDNLLIGRLVDNGFTRPQLIPMATARRAGDGFESTSKLPVQVPSHRQTIVGSFVTDGIVYAMARDGKLDLLSVDSDRTLPQIQRTVEMLCDDAKENVLTHSLRSALALSAIQRVMAARQIFSEDLVFFLQDDEGRYFQRGPFYSTAWQSIAEIDPLHPKPLATGFRCVDLAGQLEWMIVLGTVHDLAGIHAGVTRLLPHQKVSFNDCQLHESDPNLYDLTGLIPELSLRGRSSLESVAPSLHVARAPSCNPEMG